MTMVYFTYVCVCVCGVCFFCFFYMIHFKWQHDLRKVMPKIPLLSEIYFVWLLDTLWVRLTQEHCSCSSETNPSFTFFFFLEIIYLDFLLWLGNKWTDSHMDLCPTCPPLCTFWRKCWQNMSKTSPATLIDETHWRHFPPSRGNAIHCATCPAKAKKKTVAVVKKMRDFACIVQKCPLKCRLCSYYIYFPWTLSFLFGV